MKSEVSSHLYRELMNQLGNAGPTWTQYLCVVHDIQPFIQTFEYSTPRYGLPKHTMNKQLPAHSK
jgi:hypothetical protein